MTCTRSLSIVFNTIFLTTGILLVSIGGWARINFQSFQYIIGKEGAHLISNIDIVLLVVGSITTIVAFLGCYGSAKKNRCFLGIFIIIMILMVIGEIVGLIFIFTRSSDFKELIESSSKRSILQDYGMKSLAGVSATEWWDFAQKSFGCCGFTSGKDYLNSNYAKTHSFFNPWPESCCVKTEDSFVDLKSCRTAVFKSSSFAYELGCAQKIILAVVKYLPVICSIIGATILTQIMAVIFSIIIFRSTKTNQIGSQN